MNNTDINCDGYTRDGIKDTFDSLAKECIKFTKEMIALQKNGDPDDPLQANRRI